MAYLLIGLTALLLGTWALPRIIGARKATIWQRVQAVAGSLALLGAAVTFARGQWIGALSMAISSVWVLWGVRDILLPHGLPASPFGWRRDVPVVTDHLDVMRDPVTGALRGTVRKGFFHARRIQEMRAVELAHLWQDCRLTDPKSGELVKAHLDRLHPTWASDMARAEAEAPRGPDGKMTRAEALEILGLKEGVGDDEIRRSHRELMLRMHPDRGGSNYLAAKINEAKDVLTGR